MKLRDALDVDPDPVAIVVFARVDDRVANQLNYAGQLPRRAAAVLASRGVQLVLVSKSATAYVRQVQRHLNIVAPFVSDGGAALHVPCSYFDNVEGTGAGARAWEVFRFNPPDRAGAVNLLCDLLVAMGYGDPLTIGVGCDLDDYGVLAAVDVPVIVRDPVTPQKELLRHVPGAYVTNATGIEGWSEALIGP